MADIDDPIGDTLGPAEALDSDDVRNDDGDTVVDPPDDWSAANRFGVTAREQREGESLDQRLAEEEPDIEPAVPGDELPGDVEPGDGPPGRAHRGQVSGTPEDGGSLFTVAE